MISVKIISTGTLKEEYLRAAVAEYAKLTIKHLQTHKIIIKTIAN